MTKKRKKSKKEIKFFSEKNLNENLKEQFFNPESIFFFL